MSMNIGETINCCIVRGNSIFIREKEKKRREENLLAVASENRGCCLKSGCTMSFDDTSGDLPPALAVRTRLRFREPEVTLEVAASRKLWRAALQAGDRANESTSPDLRFCARI